MSKRNIIAIVQARLGSTRLPLKSLLSLRGTPVINWVAKRLLKARKLSGIIVAVPDTPLDETLAQHLERSGLPWMKGPENDVLKRFRMAADISGADIVVRVCADNPLIWWEAVDRLIDFYENSNADYAYNHIPRGNLWPDGLGAEIISADLLRHLDAVATLPAQREHCLNYIADNPGEFQIATFDPLESWLARPDLKLDLDSPEDYQKLALVPLNPESGAEEIIRAFGQA